jgi:uncharacterized membrane protein YjjB (DUF3815 family)
MTPINTALELLQDAFWSGLAALGFAILFNTPRRLLVGCFVSGAVGHAARTALMGAGISIELATLMAATIVGFLGLSLSHRMRCPASIFTITGAIPMVPGVFAYHTMIGLLSVASMNPADSGTVLVEASFNAVKTGVILSALAIGIVAPTLLFDRPKPVV